VVSGGCLCSTYMHLWVVHFIFYVCAEHISTLSPVAVCSWTVAG
jgi:hypothetical protein